jgi:hypothetical protein
LPINHAWSVFASILSWYNVSSFGGLIPNLNLVRVIAVLVVEKARGGICAAIVADDDKQPAAAIVLLLATI